MRVFLAKDDPKSKFGETLVHVEVSERDEPPTYSHSFKYKVPSGIDEKGKVYGEIIIYSRKDAASDDAFSFGLEECNNEECQKATKDFQKESKCQCPVILGKTNRLLVADVFHTKPKSDDIQKFGTALFKALFSHSAGQLLQKTEPPHSNDGIYLQLNGDVDLDAIPWEYARDRTGFLVYQRKFARHERPQDTRVHGRPQDPLPNLPLRIVVVIPDPLNEPGAADLADLRLGEQFRSFIDGFTKNKKAVKIERVFPPTVRQMDVQLMKERKTATVLHFIGHCGQKEVDGPRALIFEHSQNGRQDYIDTSRLVSTSDNLRLAFISACDSRDVARVLVKHGVPYAIGSNSSLPNVLAREFESEFYKFLTSGSTVEMAMHQARISIQTSNAMSPFGYFAGAIAFYSSTFGQDNGIFKCENGAPEIDFREPPHNLTALHTAPILHGRKTELDKLYCDLRDMVGHGTQSRHVYTIIGADGETFATEAMRRMAHLFPGGIFAWAFDKEITSAMGYFRHLVEVIFPKGVWTQLMKQHGSDIQGLGSAIIKKFRNHATCLLILDCVDILNLGRKSKNVHAETLGRWLEDLKSVRATVKILLISKEPLDWLQGEVMNLNVSGDLDTVIGGEKNQLKIRSEIHEYFEYYDDKINPSQVVQAKECFYGVPEANSAFVERSVIQEMEDTIKNSTSGGCRILALNGLGGMGKTQLMLRYCYLHKADYDYIFWMTVDSWEAAVYSYRKLAEYLGLHKTSIIEKESEQKVIKWVTNWFEKKANWLLLLDNADGEMSEKIFDLLPRIGGDIIFSTRMPISPGKARVILVDKMNEQEAIFLLYGEDPVDQQSSKFKDAQKIVIELDYIPLAVNIAQAYVKKTAISFENYLSELNEQKERTNPLEDGDKYNLDQYGNTIATVWQLSFQRIRALNPLAVQILEACAFLHPECISVCLFERQYSLFEFPSPDEKISESHSDVIGEAIAQLVDFSFVNRITRKIEDDKDGNPANDILTIHRLVQMVIYNTISSERRPQLVSKVVSALDEETKFQLSASQTIQIRRTMEAYLPHIRHLTTLPNQNEVNSKRFEKLLLRGVHHLLTNGIYPHVEELALLSIQISETINGPEHQKTATALNNLAVLYESQGKYDEAKKRQEQVLAIREKVGPEHPGAVLAMNNLGSIYQNQGAFEEAEVLFQKALTIRRKSEQNVGISLNNLAGLYRRQGKYSDAESLFRQALEISEKDFGPEHAQTAIPLNNLAGIYFSLGQYEKAEEYYSKALAIRQKELGPEHPHTAILLNNLGGLYRSQGKYEKAESLNQEALAIFKKVLGPDDLGTATALNNMARVYELQGNYTEAGPLYEQALEIRDKLLGSTHFVTAESLHNLAKFYKILGKYEEAESLYEKSLEIREGTLGPDHPVTAESLDSLAILYEIQCKHDEAKTLHQRALAIRESVLGSEHPDTAESLNNLALLNYHQGKYEEAEPLYQRALAIREKVLGPEHPDTAASLNNLALLYDNQGKYNEAESLYQRALMIREKTLGPDHPDTAGSLNSQADHYRTQRKYNEAQPLYQRALAIREKTLGSEHPDTAQSLNNLAALYDNWGKYDEAEPLYKRALAIREKALGSDHPDTAESMKGLAQLYEKRGTGGQVVAQTRRQFTKCCLLL